MPRPSGAAFAVSLQEEKTGTEVLGRGVNNPHLATFKMNLGQARNMPGKAITQQIMTQVLKKNGWCEHFSGISFEIRLCWGLSMLTVRGIYPNIYTQEKRFGV